MSDPKHPAPDGPHPGQGDDWLDVVARQVRGTRYGVVMITVHDARVVQVEWTQRSRFDTVEHRKG